MAGLFYLGGRDQSNKQDHHQENKDHHNEDKSNNYLYLYKDEIYNNNKGFEIWPPQYFQQQQQNQVAPPPPPTNFYSFGMVPSGGSNSNNRSSNRSLYFNVHEPVVRSSTGGFTVTRQGSMNCQDCGNQAKKDCPHMRCRTCCKSRGFDCQTHVKSTWVPAAKRRERLAQLAALPAKRTREASSGGGGDDDDGKDDENGDGGQGGGSALACTTRVVNPSSSGLEASHLPPEISSPAVFRCMRVSSIDDEEEEYAYQTAVSIGGHVFKGILYDQGPSDHHHNHRYSSSPVTVAAETSQHHLNLLASTATAATTTAVTNTPIDPSTLYTAAAPFNAYVAAGTSFFAPTSRS